MKRLFILALAVALTGCAAPRLSQQAEQTIKTVGIVSLVPEKAAFTKIGLTVFNNEYGEIEMGDQINATIEATLVKQLGVVRPHWTVKPLQYPRAELSKRLHSTSMVMSSPVERIEKDLAALARTHQLDAIIVVGKYRPEDTHGDGVGVLLRTFSLSSIGAAYVTSYIYANIVDPKGEVLAASWGRSLPPREIDPAAYGIQYKLADNKTPELQARLRKEIVDQLTKTTEETVRKLGL